MTGGNIYGGKFFSKNEQEICSIGTGYVANFVSGGGADRAGATLTNKRVYFSGSTFFIDAKGDPVQLKQRKVINTCDITGTSYLFFNPINYVIFAAITVLGGISSVLFFGGAASLIGLVVSLVVAGIMGVKYYLGRLTLISIEYAGGSIAFDVRWIQPHEQDNFIRNVHLAKDAIHGALTVAKPPSQSTNPVPPKAAAQSSCPHCGEIIRKSAVTPGFCRKCGGEL
ncbi:MAG: hypothetical protein FWB80_04030 [Defluviitaleaceae bacterium]|nr:hypothetical protein [Defluviitaleaceae bacterium]